MMTEEQQTLLAIEITLTGLSEESRLKVETAVEDIELVLKTYGDEGQAALALVGARLAAAASVEEKHG